MDIIRLQKTEYNKIKLNILKELLYIYINKIK